MGLSYAQRCKVYFEQDGEEGISPVSSHTGQSTRAGFLYRTGYVNYTCRDDALSFNCKAGIRRHIVLLGRIKGRGAGSCFLSRGARC